MGYVASKWIASPIWLSSGTRLRQRLLFAAFKAHRQGKRWMGTLLVLATACGSGGIVIPSYVVTSAGWGPLQPTYDGTERASAQGTHENRGWSVQLVNGTHQDVRADGNTTYVNVYWYYRTESPTTSCSGWGPSFSCSNGTSVGWNPYGSESTREISTADQEVAIRGLSADFIYNSLAPTGEGARAIIYSCAQFGWPVPDPCASATMSFSY